MGINSRARRESQNLNFAVPAATLAAALFAARTRPGILVFLPTAHAQLSLGLAYLEGRGVPQDYVQAAAWIRKAAEQGERFAQLGLGVAYANGRGVPKDYVQAAAWYRKAAEQGETLAQDNLGTAYIQSIQTPADAPERAARDGSKAAKVPGVGMSQVFPQMRVKNRMDVATFPSLPNPPDLLGYPHYDHHSSSRHFSYLWPRRARLQARDSDQAV